MHLKQARQKTYLRKLNAKKRLQSEKYSRTGTLNECKQGFWKRKKPVYIFKKSRVVYFDEIYRNISSLFLSEVQLAMEIEALLLERFSTKMTGLLIEVKGKKDKNTYNN